MLSSTQCRPTSSIIEQQVRQIYLFRFASLVAVMGMACWPLLDLHSLLSVIALTTLNLVAAPLLYAAKRPMLALIATAAFVTGLVTLLITNWAFSMSRATIQISWATLAPACLLTVIWLSYPFWRFARDA